MIVGKEKQKIPYVILGLLFALLVALVVGGENSLVLIFYILTVSLLAVAVFMCGVFFRKTAHATSSVQRARNVTLGVISLVVAMCLGFFLFMIASLASSAGR